RPGRTGAAERALASQDGRLVGVGRPPGPRPAAEMQERVLLGLLLTNPGLYEQVQEALGLCAFSQESLDKLRRGILKHLGTGRGLDAEQLSAHLRADGFCSVLESLLDASERRMLGVRGYDSAEDAKALWDDVYHRYTHRNLQADVDEASARLIEESSPASWARYQAVKRQEWTATAGEDEAGPPPPSRDGGRG
ncbi:DNA primase, partial [Phaeospirillum tilakii]